MDSVAREAWLMAWKRQLRKSRCPIVDLPPETKSHILSYLPLSSVSHLSQSCRVWHQSALPELYTRDAKECDSFAMKWMAAHAVDERTTETALNALKISARFGGQVNAFNSDFSQQCEDWMLDESSTALHHAVSVGNLRVAEKLLDMGARHDISCLGARWVWEGYIRRLNHFENVFRADCIFGQWLPIFLAFMQDDSAMARLLIDRGAGHEAMIANSCTGSTTHISILHFAAVDTTEAIFQWRFLFERFREYKNERCTEENDTPLHIALKCGCIQGMQAAVETGADMEARNTSLLTPLAAVVRQLGIVYTEDGTIQNHMRCLREFVKLGASVNPDGDSVLADSIEHYWANPAMWPDMMLIINFFVDQGADPNGTSLTGSHVASQLVRAICEAKPSERKVLKNLLSNLVARGLDLTTQSSGWDSTLNTVIQQPDAQPAWLFKLLCSKGATIHNDDVGAFFLRWCQIPRLWAGNQYDVRQHAEQISPAVARDAYKIAFSYNTSTLYDLLRRIPLAPL
ncbi:uncharacterized protein CPUR_00611 [Claviceps purpurea 20.1]|uniref:F-box domain-containing protein n=1 Tax=Claviceps purpurea (strain 20.1) TaxID=1111077 RepID=M1W9H7_CLAP2|nr:uncharacterized protein CPUR_00611 [Claviceps purpurea 20.1]